jgi:hypothetical protein
VASWLDVRRSMDQIPSSSKNMKLYKAISYKN